MIEREPLSTMPESASTRSERRDAAENRCRILDVARNLFRECGVEAVSMHQIAKAAGVGQGTLYRRYAHKGELCADLLKETAEDVLQEVNSWIAESQDNLSDLELLDHVIARVIEFVDSRAHLLAACNSAQYFDKTSSPSEYNIYHRLHEMVSSLLEEIIKNRNTATLDVTLTADMLLAALNPRLIMFEREIRGYSKEQITLAVRRIYISGLFREDF